MATQAVDKLWRFQLRKEHEQLAAKLNAHQEQLSSINSETHRILEKLNTKLNAVEKKVDKLEVDERTLGKEKNNIRDELQALKEKVGIVAKDVQRRKESSNGISSKSHTAMKEVSVSHLQNLQQRSEPSKETNTTAVRGRSSVLGSPVPYPASDDGTEDLSATPRLPTSSKSINREVAKRKRPDAVDDPIPEIPQQGTSTLKQYLTMADNLMAPFLFQPMSSNSETEFVKSFLDGLTKQAEKQTLTGILQKDLATYTTSSTGERQLIILWIDLKEAVNRSGLLEVPSSVAGSRHISEPMNDLPNAAIVAKGKGGPKQQRPKKRRKLIFSSEDSVEDGNEGPIARDEHNDRAEH